MTILVVDGSNLLIRAVKAGEAGRVHLTAEVDGIEVNTGPVLMFIRMLSRYVRQEKPDRLVVCWDGGQSVRRMAIYDGYKAERTKPRPERQVTFDLAKEFLTLAGVHHVECESVEADDLIAGYWRQGHRPFAILSGDKDFLQLLGPGVIQIRPGSKGAEVWTHLRVLDEMGCEPECVPAVMALTGDKGDGVPGIPGYGIKTAVKVLKRVEWDLDSLCVKDETLDLAVLSRNYSLVDLRSPADDVHLSPLPPFEPTAPSSLLYDDLVRWLDRYRMASVLDSLVTDSLWRE